MLDCPRRLKASRSRRDYPLNISSDSSDREAGGSIFGPFTTTETVSEHGYRFSLPDTMPIHKVFHVHLLSPHGPNCIDDRSQPPTQAVIIDGEEDWETESILDTKLNQQYKTTIVSRLIPRIQRDPRTTRMRPRQLPGTPQRSSNILVHHTPASYAWRFSPTQAACLYRHGSSVPIEVLTAKLDGHHSGTPWIRHTPPVQTRS
jgi:hypothetical protein